MLKKRIEKMKSSTFRAADIRLCRTCHKEFNEKENYNWSCRTHQSDFGGVMWWCCGRRNKEDPGCKYSKHESRDDLPDKPAEGQVDMEELARLQARRRESIRCHCCKKFGHSGFQCEFDPNMQTVRGPTAAASREMIAKEEHRIEKITESDSKKKKVSKLGVFNKFVIH